MTLYKYRVKKKIKFNRELDETLDICTQVNPQKLAYPMQQSRLSAI